MRVHQVPCTALSYTTPAESLSSYSASEGNSRGFCSACGSFLYWRHDKGDKISVCVGTFDRDVLKEWGAVLTKAERHLYCDDEVKGVTDHLEGKRWPGDC